MYAAVVLDDSSADTLSGVVRQLVSPEDKGWKFSTPRGDALPHHVTLNLGRLNESLNSAALLGRQVHIEITSLAYCDDLGICAAKVGTMQCTEGDCVRSMNEHPHITCCLKPGQQPKFSNDLLKNENGSTTIIAVEPSLYLSGTLRVCD